MSSWILQDCTSVWLCIEKTQDSFKEVWVDGMFPMKSSANESYGKIPMVYNPTNQTTKIGKIPKDKNPPKFLWESFESKKPLIYFMIHGIVRCKA